MIITLNLRNNPSFIKMFYQQGFFDRFLQVLKELPKQHKSIIFGILNNLFLEEYKEIYFLSEPIHVLEEIFITNK